MIIIKQQEDYTKVLKLQYADTQAPVDLTDVIAASELRKKPGATPYLTAACTVDASEGVIRVYYSSAQTASLEEGEYGYDVWIIEDGKKHPIYTTLVQVVKPYTNLGA